jgi:DNA modification methylase
LRLVQSDKIEVRERQREIDPKTVGNIEDSLTTKRILLHAPVMRMDGETVVLVVGEHRCLAINSLHKKGKSFLYDGSEVPIGQTPCLFVEDMSEAELLELELEENIFRSEIPWQARARAIAAIHKARQKENPAQTFSATAEVVAQREGKQKPTGDDRAAVRNSVILAENLHRPEIAKARNASEAIGILMKNTEAAARAALIAKRNSAIEGAAVRLIEVRHGDFTKILPTLDEKLVDLVVADLPYGINVDKGGFRSRTVEHHNYEDSPEYATVLMQSLIVDSFRVCKERANMFLFMDIDFFPLFKKACQTMGWKPFRTPIIYQKSESEGLAPWGAEGPRRTYEVIGFATKGNRGLHQSPTDILTHKRVSRADRRLGPEKPVSLMEELIECGSMPGDFVLDPCCGGGSTLIAMRHLKRRGLGIELNQEHYNLAVVAAESDPETKSETEDLA